MSPEERDLLTGLFQRIQSAGTQPRDAEAEGLIDGAVRAMPYAPYLLAQAVLTQDNALKAAVARVQQLEAQVSDLQARAQAGPAPQPARSFLGGLFGQEAPAQPVQPQRAAAGWQTVQQPAYAPQPQYAPAPAQGPWGSAPQAPAGGGFLRSAATTAAGVAGGVLLADGLQSLFGGHGGFGGGGFGGGGFGNSGFGNSGFGGGREEVIQNETVVNNYYGSDPNGADDRVLGDNTQDASYDDGGSSDFGGDSGSYDA